MLQKVQQQNYGAVNQAVSVKMNLNSNPNFVANIRDQFGPINLQKLT
jgi:hypothetical protein